jgi:hypothetical protein
MKYEMQKEETSLSNNESGRMGYIIAWLFGVPASVLFFIFLVRGH